MLGRAASWKKIHVVPDEWVASPGQGALWRDLFTAQRRGVGQSPHPRAPAGPAPAPQAALGRPVRGEGPPLAEGSSPPLSHAVSLGEAPRTRPGLLGTCG